MSPRGGRRKPDGRAVRPPGVGKASTRTDLGQAAQAIPLPKDAPNLTFGARKQLQEARQAMPVTSAPAPSAPQRPVSPLPPAGPPPPFNRPTERPGEPVTAGIPLGPGPGPEVLARNPQATLSRDQVAARLERMIQHLPAVDARLMKLVQTLRGQAGLPPSLDAPILGQSGPAANLLRYLD